MTYSYAPMITLLALAISGSSLGTYAQQPWEMKAQGAAKQTPAEIRVRDIPVQSGSFNTSGEVRGQPLIRVERPPVIDVTTVRGKIAPSRQPAASPRVISPRPHR